MDDLARELARRDQLEVIVAALRGLKVTAFGIGETDLALAVAQTQLKALRRLRGLPA
jgi:hypothetical protein